jgi:hypothetical protein
MEREGLGGVLEKETLPWAHGKEEHFNVLAPRTPSKLPQNAASGQGGNLGPVRT